MEKDDWSSKLNRVQLVNPDSKIFFKSSWYLKKSDPKTKHIILDIKTMIMVQYIITEILTDGDFIF